MIPTITIRQKELLNYLHKSKQAIPIRELASAMKVSSRMIRYDLKNLSYNLKEFDLKLEIIPSKGVYLADRTNSKWLELFEHKTLVNSQTRRNRLMVDLLLYPKVSVNAYAEKNFVNRQTITRDISELISLNWISDKNIKRTTHGISLDFDKNALIEKFLSEIQRIDFMETMLNETECHFSSIDKKSKLWIDYVEEINGAEFETISRKTLNVISNFLCIRSTMSKSENNIKTSYMFSDKFDLYWDLESYQCIEQVLLASRLIRGSLPIKGESTLVDDLLNELIHTLSLTIKPQDDAYLSLKLHLKAALNRSKFKLKIENPLKDDVRLSYSILFEAVSSVLTRFEQSYPISFSENEIAFIVMHIGAIIQSQVKLQAKITVAVVCQHGMATSRLLQSRLKLLMPNQNLLGPYSVSEFLSVQKSQSFDLVISTIPIEDINPIIVNPLLNTHDIEMIERILWSLIYQKQCDLLVKNFTLTHQTKIKMSQLIKLNHFQFIDKFEKWEKAIEFASKPLIMDGVILPNYITKMIWAVDSLGPYMVILPKIAFVHAGNQDGVIKNGISCLRMSKSILFGNQKAADVQVIFIIASKEKEDMGLLKLVQIIENKKNYETLLTSNDMGAIMALEG